MANAGNAAGVAALYTEDAVDARGVIGTRPGLAASGHGQPLPIRRPGETRRQARQLGERLRGAAQHADERDGAGLPAPAGVAERDAPAVW